MRGRKEVETVLQVILRRLAIGLLFVLPIAIFVVFFLSLYGPGDPVQIMLGQRSNPEAVERVRHQLGLDKPILVQYSRYLWNIFHGNFGESIKYRGQPVGRLLDRCVRVTAPLNAAALSLGALLGIPLGLLAAFKRDTIIDRLIRVLVVVGISFPIFTIAPMLLYLFAVKLRLLPPGGWEGVFSKAAILPVSVLCLGPLAVLTRQTRAAVLATITQDYVRTAYAKGLSHMHVMLRHVLRNALIPVTTIIGLMLGGLVSGSLLTEMIFGIPGCGALAVSAVQGRDYFLIAGFTLLYLVSIYAANLGVDLAYPALDPRTREESSSRRSPRSRLSSPISFPQVRGIRIKALLQIPVQLASVVFSIPVKLGRLTAALFFNLPKKLWKADKLAFFGYLMVSLMFLTAIFGSVLAPYGYNEQNLDATKLPPSLQHLLGTDRLGRDVFSMIVWGAQPAAFFVVFSLLIGTPLGIIIGAISGYYRGRIDTIVMRITDVFFAFPGLLFLFFIAATLGPRIDAVVRELSFLAPVAKAGYIDYVVVIVIFAFISWPGMTRLVRAQFLSIRERDYVLAAEAIGASDWRIIFRHVLPNAMPPIIVSLSMGAGGLIMAEAFLSFLGIGLTAKTPHPSWGVMIFTNYEFWRTTPYLLWAPGLVVGIMILSFNLLGDGLNKVLDPESEKGGGKL